MSDSDANNRADRSHKLLVGLFLSANFLYWISLYLYMPTLPSFSLTKTPDLALVGVVLSMYGLWQMRRGMSRGEARQTGKDHG